MWVCVCVLVCVCVCMYRLVLLHNRSAFPLASFGFRTRGAVSSHLGGASHQESQVRGSYSGSVAQPGNPWKIHTGKSPSQPWRLIAGEIIYN